MILTEIGEIGVHAGDRVFTLRPSLYAMSRIGSPAYIVEIYAAVMADHPITAPGVVHMAQLGCVYEVLQACTEEDISDLIGAYEHNEEIGQFVYKKGLIPPREMLHLARCLMRHGVTGSVEPLPSDGDDEPDYVAEFDVRKHVANAIAHLGMSEKDAWNTTMTALVDALRSKFPVVKDENKAGTPPTVAEYEATMDWADKIEAKRKLRLGIKD